MEETNEYSISIVAIFPNVVKPKTQVQWGFSKVLVTEPATTFCSGHI